MLRNVLEDYLSSVNERDFDYPLTSLLHAMGFYDIHLTHGKTEFGKDFIAKKAKGEVVYQYSIQSKKGDVKQGEFRNTILGQLMEASLLDIVHPQFDNGLPRRVIFVTTGRLVGNAALSFQAMNTALKSNYHKSEVEFWGQERIIELFETYGLTGIHQNTARGLNGYGQFYLTYSRAIEGDLPDREIEVYSRVWLDETLDTKKRILRAAIEADILSSQLLRVDRTYEALIVNLSVARTILETTYQPDNQFICELYRELVATKILPLARVFIDQIRTDWDLSERRWDRVCFSSGSLPMITYLVWCSRVVEIAALRYFLSDDQEEKHETGLFLSDFISAENGCGHIAGDRYAVSAVWAALALFDHGQSEVAKKLVAKGVVWVCDRFEFGFGIANYEADEYQETAILIGYPFEGVSVARNRSSFYATALVDLAAFSGDTDLYADAVNDIEACEIVYSYWQFPDSKAIFIVDSEECVTYPNIPHVDALGQVGSFEYAEHIRHEPVSFAIMERVGTTAIPVLSLLLRDRYFPTVWSQYSMHLQTRD